MIQKASMKITRKQIIQNQNEFLESSFTHYSLRNPLIANKEILVILQAEAASLGHRGNIPAYFMKTNI